MEPRGEEEMRWSLKMQYIHATDSLCPHCQRAKRRAWVRMYLGNLSLGYSKPEAFAFACLDAKHYRCRICAKLASLRDTIGTGPWHTRLVELDGGRAVIIRPAWGDDPEVQLEVRFKVWISKNGKFMGIVPQEATLRWGDEVRRIPSGALPHVGEVVEKALLAHALGHFDS